MTLDIQSVIDDAKRYETARTLVYLGFFECVHNARVLGKERLKSLLAVLLQ